MCLVHPTGSANTSSEESLVGRSLISLVHEHENDPLICQLVDSSEEFSSSSGLHSEFRRGEGGFGVQNPTREVASHCL